MTFIKDLTRGLETTMTWTTENQSMNSDLPVVMDLRYCLTPWQSFPFLWHLACLWPRLCLRLRLGLQPCTCPAQQQGPCPWPPQHPCPCKCLCPCPQPWPPLGPQCPHVNSHKSIVSTYNAHSRNTWGWTQRNWNYLGRVQTLQNFRPWNRRKTWREMISNLSTQKPFQRVILQKEIQNQQQSPSVQTIIPYL